MRNSLTPCGVDIRQALLVRSSSARVFEYRDTVSFLHGNGALRFDGIHACVARSLIELLDEPRTRAAVLEAACAKVPQCTEELFNDVLMRIVAVRAVAVIEPGADVSQTSRPAAKGRAINLCLGVSGAIGSLNAPFLIQALQEKQFSVRVAMTRSATRLLRRRGLEALTHSRVFTSCWQSDRETPIPHITLAKWADVVLLWPATATTIARIASGSFDDLVAAIALVSRGPVIIAPSMNREMYTAPSVRRNVSQLRADGFYVLQPGLGCEAAVRPEERVPGPGAALPVGAICDLVSFISKQGMRSERPSDSA